MSRMVWVPIPNPEGAEPDWVPGRAEFERENSGETHSFVVGAELDNDRVLVPNYAVCNTREECVRICLEINDNGWREGAIW